MVMRQLTLDPACNGSAISLERLYRLQWSYERCIPSQAVVKEVAHSAQANRRAAYET